VYEALKQRAYKANMALMESGLVVLTWGNSSGADRAAGVFAIKPSGVPYDQLKADDMVVLRIDTGEVVEGKARPSSDTPTHLVLYQKFPACNGIVHTHSEFGTAFAQAGRDIPCLGTTHADNFYGPIPCTRPMKPEEIQKNYEHNTGLVIVERFEQGQIDPAQVPGCLVAGHAPFAWGETPEKAIENAIVLEFTAKMAVTILHLNPQVQPISQVLLDKHFLRKHGPGAYYGQKN
jgi:L-ribulose-5-phosphate 4-epimerase